MRRMGKRATGGEIYNAIVETGVEISGSSTRRSGIVCARLSRAPAIFDHTPEGYGLREWSDSDTGRKHGHIGP